MTSHLKNNRLIHNFFLSRHSKKKREQKKEEREKEEKYIEEENSEIIIKTIKSTLNNLLSMDHKHKRAYLMNLKIKKEFKSPHHYSASVYLLDNYIVRKNLKSNKLGYFLFLNEINALQKLSSFEHFPKLIGYDFRQMCIYMTFCGDQISKENIPLDWTQQLNEIQKDLLLVNVNSNDMILRNVCVLNEKIYIIDFGLYSQFGVPVQQSIYNLRYELQRISR